MDGLDEQGVLATVRKAKPEVIVHQLTALQGVTNLRRFDDAFASTNRLRTEGLDYLLQAARAVEARRLIAQSYTGWPNIREGGPVKTEDDPLDPMPLPSMAKTLAAIRHLEETLSGAEDIEGVALRYGGFYGYGTSLGEGGEHMRLFMKRRFPIIGDGGGIWSFTHIDDAASATIAALEHGKPGVYNVVDDEPAPVSEWLPYLAQAIGAKPPRRIPVWLGRLAAGEAAVLKDDRGAWVLEREGQAGARLAAALPELARRLPPRPRQPGGGRAAGRGAPARCVARSADERLDEIGEALGPARQRDARIRRWFIRTPPRPDGHASHRPRRNTRPRTTVLLMCAGEDRSRERPSPFAHAG